MIVFGVDDTMRALEGGAVDLVLLYEELEINRYVLKNTIKGDTKIIYLTEK
jgi:peptide chain release factor subunit 1